jgi:hypothetical protein
LRALNGSLLMPERPGRVVQLLEGAVMTAGRRSGAEGVTNATDGQTT